MMRILVATVLLHTALNGILPAAIAAAVDDEHRVQLEHAWEQIKGLLP